MNLTQQKIDDAALSQQSAQFIQNMVNQFLLMSSQDRQIHLKQINDRIKLNESKEKNIMDSKSTQGSSSFSTQDRSPTQLKKTTSIITDQKIDQFMTQPQINTKSQSQQLISNEKKTENDIKSKRETNSQVSQQYNLSALEINEINLYPMPQNIITQKDQQEFFQKYIMPLKFLGIVGSQQNYVRVAESRSTLQTEKLQNNFKEVKGLGLFYMDLVTKLGRSRDIGKTYIAILQNLKKLLMFKIQIGMHFQRKDLLKVFNIHWQSLTEVILQRIWSKDSEQEHGLDFFKCQENLKKIKKIMLLGNYLSQQVSKSLEKIQLPQLQVLEMNFEKQIEHVELYNIFNIISKYNDKFQIHLVSDMKDKSELSPQLASKYGERIYLIDRSQKPSQNLQKVRPSEQIKYEKPQYQINHESNQKMGLKQDYIPKMDKRSMINPNLPLNQISSAQPLKGQYPNDSNLTNQQNSMISNPNNNLLSGGNQPVFLQSQQFSNLQLSVTHNSTLQGGIRIGTSQVNQKNEHHHHTQIVHQITQRVIQRQYTNYQSNNGYQNNWNNYNNNYEPQWKNGYSYGGRNNKKYNKYYNNYNNYNGYYKKWHDYD